MNSDQKKPQIAYRVELQKKIEINKSFSQRRNQAVALRILSYGLFGQKRYQNLYLTCSLNCFHLALRIANTVHQRVAGLAMIIRFQTVQVLEYYAEEFNGKYFEEKKFSKITIKLTKNPTEDDKKQAGFNPGLSMDEIEEPLTQVLARKKDQRGFSPNKEKRPSRQENQYRKKKSNFRDQRPPNHRKPHDKTYDKPHDKSYDRPYEKSERYKENSYDDNYRRGEKKMRGRGSANASFGGRYQEDRKGPQNNRDNRGKRNPKRTRYDDDDD